MKTLWLHRPLLNWPDVYRWAESIGIPKMLPPAQLHTTLCTVRQPVEWGELNLQTDELVIPAGCKVLQIFGYMAKGLAFGSPQIKERHEELAARFPQMDHPELLRPHVTLFRGGKMYNATYDGELVFGPERADEFNMQAVREIKHFKVKNVLNGMEHFQ